MLDSVATTQQVKPSGNGADITDLVTEDLAKRREMGIQKYGQSLRAFNGRSALIDAYREQLDHVLYLRQQICEQGDSDPRRFVEVFNAYADYIHKWAQGKGFWSAGKNRNDGEMIALMHSELSEALESLRRKIDPTGEQCPKCDGVESKIMQNDAGYCCRRGHTFRFHPVYASDHIPEFLGIEEEFADLIIRVMDMAHARGWKVGAAIVAKMRFNEGRPHMHGKQF